MTTSRTLADRLMPLIVPKMIASYAPPPTQVAGGLWALERKMRMPGGPVLPTWSPVIALTGGELLVASPPPVEAGGFEALDALGRVRHVLVTNSFHYLNTRRFLARYAGAALWVAPGLRARVGDAVPEGTEVTEGLRTPWSDVLEHTVLGPVHGISEVALFHRATATLILTDLAFNMVRFQSTFDRIAWRMSGVPAGFGYSRTARVLLLRDRQAASSFLHRILAWPFRRIVVAHGDTVEADAEGVFRRAFASWL